MLEPNGQGPKACPKGSGAGPVGRALGVVAFGSRKSCPRKCRSNPSNAPGGGLEFFAYGHSPAIIEVISKARYVNAGGNFSHELIAEVPLVETVPGAQDASVEHISVKVGSAIRKNGKTIYYGRVPDQAPQGRIPAKAELTFAGLGGLTQQTVTNNRKVRCPPK